MADKKYDPRMHTAEHILNRTMVRKIGTNRSFSSHLDGKKGKCDYRFTRNLSPEETALLMGEINRVISSELPVTEEFIARAEASAEFNLSRLPEEAGDSIRVVRVGDYDACPCIGPHVPNTSEVGVFRIISSDCNDGILRVRFKLD